MYYYVSKDGCFLSQDGRINNKKSKALTEKQMRSLYREATLYDMCDFVEESGYCNTSIIMICDMLDALGLSHALCESPSHALEAIRDTISKSPEVHAWKKREMPTDAEHELLSILPNAFKYLHTQHGFNFCRPHKVCNLQSPFTYNSLKKMLKDEYGEEISMCKVALLIKSPYSAALGMYHAHVDDARIETTPPILNDMSRREYVATRWREEDVENHIIATYQRKILETLRKASSTSGYVIFQSRKYILDIERPENFMPHFCDNTRYRFAGDIAKDTYGKTRKEAESYKIDKYIILRVRELGGATSKYSEYRMGTGNETLMDILDASGYCVGMYRRSLYARLAAFKEKKSQ